jgi:hypothetical protein
VTTDRDCRFFIAGERGCALKRQATAYMRTAINKQLEQDGLKTAGHADVACPVENGQWKCCRYYENKQAKVFG